MGADFDTGFTVAVARFDTFQMVLDVQVQTAFTLCFLQWNRFHAGLAAYLFGDYFPATAIDNQCSVFSDKSQAVIAPVSSVVDTDCMIPHDGEVIDCINCL